jgi:hypothetical protein
MKMCSRSGGRLLGVPEGAGEEQALPGARRGGAVLHRTTKISYVRPTRRPLPEGADLYEQTR